MSAKTKPSRTTVSPTTTSMGRANIGPAVTQVWNSPRSPHGSAHSRQLGEQGRVEGAAGERRVEARAGRRCSAWARRPPSIISPRQRRGRDVPQRKQRRQAGASEPLLAVAAHVLEEQVAERDVGEPVGHEPRPPPSPMRRSYSSLLHGHGSGTTWSGRPAARPAPRGRRAGRRASPPGRTPRWWWSAGPARPRGIGVCSTCSIHAESLPLDHETRIFIARPPGAAHRPCRSTASATRGPGTTRPSPARTWTRPVFTAGTAASRLQIAIVVGGVGGGPGLVFVQLEDHVRGAGEDQLGRGLHRLALDVGEDVDAAGGGQHVVQEAAAAAGVDVPQRAVLAAEHQQHARAGPPGGPLARSRRCAARGRRPPRRRVAAAGARRPARGSSS